MRPSRTSSLAGRLFAYHSPADRSHSVPMQQFEFSLQQVLDLRRHQRVEAERHLAKIRRKIRALRKEARHIRERLEASAGREVPERSSPRNFQQRAAHRENVRAAHREVRERIDALRRQEEDARRELIARRRDEESLEALRDEEKSRHTARAEKVHQQLMDEQAITRFARDQSNDQP